MGKPNSPQSSFWGEQRHRNEQAQPRFYSIFIVHLWNICKTNMVLGWSILWFEKFSLSLLPNYKFEWYARRKSPKISAGRTKEGRSRDVVNVVEGYPSKWLSEELGVNPSTVSKWCTNSSQPDLETIARIAKLLNVGVEELFNKKFMESV